MQLIYGFDALCGWCFGFVPAMRRVVEDHPGLPVTLAMAGLVSGGRVGPYAQMESYILGASQRLEAATGRKPSAAFFDLPPLDDSERAEVIWETGREIGITSFPTLILRSGAKRLQLPTLYDPDEVSRAVGAARRQLATE